MSAKTEQAIRAREQAKIRPTPEPVVAFKRTRKGRNPETVEETKIADAAIGVIDEPEPVALMPEETA